MHLMTKKTVAKLLAETGHALDVEDFDLIEELDSLARNMSGVSPDERRLLSSPFELCSMRFYPLTIAKSLWYAEKVEEWDLDPIYHEVCLFWLLTLPNTSEALDAVTCRKDAMKGIKRVVKRLNCPHSDIDAMLKSCIGSRGEKATQSESVAYGGLVACLLREYRGTPEQWLYETPVEQIGELMAQFVRRINAENDAAQRKASSGGKAVAPPPSAKLNALRAFRLKTAEIREAWDVREK